MGLQWEEQSRAPAQCEGLCLPRQARQDGVVGEAPRSGSLTWRLMDAKVGPGVEWGRVHWALPAQRCGPPAGNGVPREQREPPPTTNCPVIFLPLPGRQQAEHLKQQRDAAGSFKALDGFPSGLHTSFLHLSPSLPLAPPGFVNTAPSFPPSLLPPSLPPTNPTLT